MTTGFSFNNAMKKLTVSDIDTYLNKIKFGVKLERYGELKYNSKRMYMVRSPGE